MRVMPSDGSAALSSLIMVGTKACVSGISGALRTSLTKSVKWSVRLTISWLAVSTATRCSRTHCRVASS